MTRRTPSTEIAANQQRCSAASFRQIELYRADRPGLALITHHQMKHAEHAEIARAYLWAAIDGRDHLENSDFGF
jgi:hypothetical protein